MTRTDAETTVLAGIALLLVSRMFVRASTVQAADTGQRFGAWRIVPSVPTGRDGAATFDRNHWGALQRGLATHNAPTSARRRLALAMLAQMLSETGRGSEWNFNVANSNPNANWSGDVAALPGAGEQHYQRAYDSLQAGVDDYLRSITGSTYGLATGALAAGTMDASQWYARVRELGWTARSASADELAIYQIVLAHLEREFPT